MTNYIRAFLVLFFFGLLTACGGGGGGGNTAMTMLPPPTVTITPRPTLEVTSPDIGAYHYLPNDKAQWLVLLSVSAEGKVTVLQGNTITIRRQMIASYQRDSRMDAYDTPDFNRASLHATGDLVPLVENGATVYLTTGQVVPALETNTAITALFQYCSAPWLRSYIGTFSGDCAGRSQLSYTPNMPNVLHAAMADTFHRGIGIGESRFAFSGRHNGNDRA
ncbi:MAG: hypothetical protein ACR2P4_04845, partial [Gammaproteobacteria bacterium]